MNTYQLEVKGLTCGHCVASVTEEISEISAVTAVEVALNAGKEAVSVATVNASAEVTEEAFQTAVAEAGYQLVSFSQN